MLDFLLVYEHKAREFDSVCLLKAELECRGYTVDIVNIRDWSKQLNYKGKNKPKVIIVPAMYSDRSLYNQVYRFTGKINKIVNLQWEQVFVQNDDMLKFKAPKGLARDVLHLCWGENSCRWLNSVGTSKAVVTGPIHMDFVRKELAGLYMNRQEINDNYALGNKKLVLYISSFVLDSYDDDMLASINSTVGYDMSEQKHFSGEEKQATIECLKKLLEKDESLVVVYRPHPGEFKDSRLSKLEKEQPRFRVIADGNVKQWILVADKIVTWISTSIVEVFFAGKGCALLRHKPVPKAYDIVIYEGRKAIFDDDDEFCCAISSDTPLDFPIPRENIYEHYRIDERRPAFMYICDTLEEVLTTDRYNIKNPHYNPLIVWRLRMMCRLKRAYFGSNLRIEKWGMICKTKLAKKMEFLRNDHQMWIKEFASPIKINTRVSEIKKVISV